MAGSSNARRLTEADKARIVAVLAANDGNVKRTARDLGIGPATVRRYRDQHAHGAGPSPGAVAQAVGDFVQDAERVRDKALVLLEQRIDDGDIKSSELITVTGVLTDKVRLAQNLPTSKVEHSAALPAADDLREALGPVIQGAIEAAARREHEIVEAEIVEVLELPQTTVA